MLAPETLNLHRSSPKEKRYKYKDSNDLCTNLIKNGSTIGTKLTLVVPGASSSLCFKIQDQLCNDKDYYEARCIPNLGQLLFSKDFIKSFVMQGQFYLQSLIQNCETDDGLTIMPGGRLYLWTDKSTIQNLNVDGLQNYSLGKNRILAVYNLREIFTDPSKSPAKILAKWRDSFRNIGFVEPLTFSWTPDDESLCPSSVAKYFTDGLATVEVNSPNIFTKNIPPIPIPILTVSDEQGYDEFEFDAIEDWIGALLLQSYDRKLVKDLASLASIHDDQEIIESVPLHIIQSDGVYFQKDLTELIQVLTNEMKSNHESGVPWIILSTRNGIIAQNNINSNMKVKTYHSANSTFIMLKPNCTVSRTLRY